MKKNNLPEVKYEPEPGTATYMAKLIAGANQAEHNTLTHRSNTNSGHTSLQSSLNRTVIKTSTYPTSGATAIGPQFVIVDGQANTKRGRHNNSISQDDSVLTMSTKKQKDELPRSLSQPQKSSTLNLEEELNMVEKLRHLKIKIKEMSLEVSDKMKYWIPIGGGKVRKHFSLIEFATHLRNNDIIMDGERKREILKETENSICAKFGHEELSVELSYSGSRMISSMTSDEDLQVFP